MTKEARADRVFRDNMWHWIMFCILAVCGVLSYFDLDPLDLLSKDVAR